MILKLRREHIFKTIILKWCFGLLVIAGTVPVFGFTEKGTPEAPVDVPPPVVEGHRLFSTEQIVSLLVDAGWKRGEQSEAIKALQEAYYKEGRLFVSLRLETRGSETVLLIDEGDKARYGSVRLYGAKERGKTEIQRALGVERGAPFSPRELDERMAELLERYDELGFPFAQVWVDSLGVRPDSTNAVDVVLYVVEGGKKLLSRVEVEGLLKTRKDFVVELSGLKTGVPYNGRSIEDAYLRLRGSGIFEEVGYPEVRLSPEGDGVEALLVLREPRRFNSLSSALGYAKEEAGEKKILSGLVRLSLLNIGGTLRDLSIFWNNDGAGKNETKLAYKDRFIFGRNLGLGVSLEQVGLDTLYTWQSAGLEIERPFARIGGSLVTLKGAVSGDRNVYSEGDLLRSWRLRIASGLAYVRGALGGRSTLSIETLFTWARKKVHFRQGSSDEFLSQYIVESRGKIDIDFTRTFHFFNETVYKGLESSERPVPLPEQFYLGGTRTLRGYRENQFHGRRIGYSRWELIIGNKKVDNAYLFADGGYVLQEIAENGGGLHRRNRFYAGYGFGLRTASKLGNVDISFGVGERLSLRQTKVHVILEQTF